MNPRRIMTRNLRLLWGGQLISQSGNAITQMATIWLMLELTGSSVLTGMVAFAGTFPALIFGLLAGVLVDRYNRRRLMITSDFLRLFLVLTIPLLYINHALTPLILAGIVFLMATFGTLFNPARDAILPQLSFPRHLFRVNALMQSTGYFAYFAGLFGAGLLMGVMGLINLFYLDAITFAFSLMMISFMVIPTIASPVDRAKLRVPAQNWQELKLGLYYIRVQDRRVLWIIALTALNNFFIMGPAVVGIPLVIKSVWNGTGSDFAFVEATYGVGMLLGTVLIYRFVRHYRKGVWLMVGMLYDGLSFIPVILVDQLGINPLYALISIIFIHSVGIPFIQVTRTSLIHSIVPNNMQGRTDGVGIIAGKS